MRLHPSLLLPVVVVCAFAGGLVSSKLLEREAKAQSAPFAATVYVPADGLAFRTFDGRVVARLSYGAHGGVFELYDDREQPVTSPRPDATPAAAVPAPAATERPALPPLRKQDIKERVIKDTDGNGDLGY